MATETDKYILDISIEGISGTAQKVSGLGNNLKDARGQATGMVDGLKSATKAALAFIATPLGLFVTALAVGFKLVKEAISRSNDALDLLEDITTSVSTAINVLLDNMDKLADIAVGIGKILTGDVVGGFKQVTGAAKALGEEFSKEIALTLDLNARLRDLEDRTIDLDVATAKYATQIKALLLQAKARNITEQERADLLQKAEDLEIKLATERDSISKGELAAIAEREGATKNFYKLASESAEDFALRLIKTRELQDANRDAVVKALKDYYAAQNEGLVLQEKIDQKQEEARLKRKAKAEEEYAIKQALLHSEQFDHELTASKVHEVDAKAYQNKTTFDSLYIAAQKKVSSILIDVHRKEADIQAQIDQDLQKRRLATLNRAVADSAVVFGKQSSIYKAAASSQTLISTYLAAQESYASLAGIPIIGPALGFAAAALAVAAGLKNVQAINKTPAPSFAQGGQFKTIGGKDHAQGGTKFYGEDGSRFEAQNDEGLFILKREAHRDYINTLSGLNQKHGGRSWTSSPVSYAAYGGEVATANIAQKSLQSSDIVNLILATVRNLPPPVVTVEAINAKQSEVNQVQVAARV
jgi:hypothetical protein